MTNYPGDIVVWRSIKYKGIFLGRVDSAADNRGEIMWGEIWQVDSGIWGTVKFEMPVKELELIARREEVERWCSP